MTPIVTSIVLLGALMASVLFQTPTVRETATPITIKQAPTGPTLLSSASTRIRRVYKYEYLSPDIPWLASRYDETVSKLMLPIS